MKRTKTWYAALVGTVLAFVVALTFSILSIGTKTAGADSETPEVTITSLSNAGGLSTYENTVVDNQTYTAYGCEGWGGILSVLTLDRSYDASAVYNTGKGAFTFWLYFATEASRDAYADMSGNFNIDVSSGSEYSDSTKYSFMVSAMFADCAVGWNKVTIPFSTAAEKNNMDWSNVSFIRLNGTGSGVVAGDSYLKFAGFSFTVTEETSVTVERENVEVSVASVSLNTLSSYEMTLEGETVTAYGCDGWGNVLSCLDLDGSYNVQTIASTGKGALIFWLYIVNETTLDAYQTIPGSFNIDVSAGSSYSDSTKYSFSIAPLFKGLYLGWNKIVLPLETANEKNNMDWSDVSYIRLNGDGSGFSSAVSYLRFARFSFAVAEETERSVYNDLTGTDVTFAFNTESVTDNPSFTQLEKDDGTVTALYAQGIGGYLATPTFDRAYSVNSALVNSTKAALSVWVYFPNEESIDQYSHFNIDLCSGAPNEDYAYSDSYKWTFSISSAFSMCSVGWNQIVMPFSAVTEGNRDALDWSNVRGVRFNVGGPVACSMAIAELTITTSDYTELTVVGYVPPVVEDPSNVRIECDGDTGLHLDSFEEGWGDGAVITTAGYYKEGSGAWRLYGQGTGACGKTLASTYDLSEYTSVSFWLYVDDISAFGGMADGQFELRSENDDDHELNWSLKTVAATLKDGWNYVTLAFEDGTATNDFDITSVKYLRIYFVGLSSMCETVFDDLHAHKDSAGFVIESFDNGFSTQVETLVGKVGNATNMSGEGWVARVKYSTAIDIADYDMITLWVYCGDETSASVIAGTEIELSSSGTCDKNELAFFLPEGLEVGWNFVTFNVADGKETGGSIDLTAVNFLGVVKTGLPRITVYFDDLRAVESKNLLEAEAPIDIYDLINCDKQLEGADGWTVDDEDYKEGTGALTTTGEAPAFEVTFSALNTGLALTGEHRLGLAFWLYVDDASTASVEIKLSSSETAGAFELKWTAGSLIDGWNWITLDVADADRIGGVIDLSSVCRISISVTSEEAITAKLDCIRLVDVSADNAFDPVDEKRVLEPIDQQRLSDCETAWTGATVNETEKKQGYGSAEISKQDSSAASVTAYTSIDVGQTDLLITNLRADNELGITLWLYAEDTGAIGEIVFCLANSASSGKLEWKIGGLQDGWNWVVLRASEATISGTVDPDSLGYMSVTVTGAQDADVYVGFKVLVDRVSLVNCAIAANTATPDDEALTRDPVQEIVFIDCDSVGGTVFTGNKVDKEDFRYSTGAVYTSGAGYALTATDLEIGKTDLTKDTLVLAFWIWIEDITLYDASGVNTQVELTSSNTYDKNEIHWDNWFEGLSDGWNWVVLKGSDATETGGLPDFDNLRYFRLYVNGIANSTMKIDRVTLGYVGNAALFEEPDWENEKASAGIFKGANGFVAENDTYIEVDFNNPDEYTYIETEEITVSKNGCNGSLTAGSVALIGAAVGASVLFLKKRGKN